MEWIGTWLLGKIWEISLMVGSALIGWGLAEPHRLPSWLFFRSRSQLSGEDWTTAWQSDPKGPSHWTFDKVRLSRRLGKLRVVVIESSDGYDWETSLLKKGSYFIGTFRSKKPDSSACGTLTLRLSDQGDRFVGFHCGPSKFPRLMSGKVVIARPTEVPEVQRTFDDFL